jgi:hypothetical protein
MNWTALCSSLAFVLLSAPTFAQTTSTAHAFLAATNEQAAVIHAGRACKVISDAEMNYWYNWYKQTAFAISSLLTEADEAAFSKQRLSTRNIDLVEAQIAAHTKEGCASPGLLSKVSALKRSLRLNGLAIKKLDDTYAGALQDLHKNTAP